MRSVAAALSIVLAASTAGAEPLTLDAALKTADQHQPDVRVARGQQAGADAQADEARAPLFPQLDANANYNLSGDEDGGLGSPTDSLRAGANLSILLWDFGQVSRRWRAAQWSAASAAHETNGALLDAHRQVRLAYFQALGAKELVGVARESLTNEQRHLDQIAAFVEVGNRPQIDLVQSRTAVANAKVALIRAENAYAAAKAQLNVAMGVEGSTGYDVADAEMPAVAGEDRPAEDLMKEALQARPDVAALSTDRRAAELTLDATRASSWPTLRANAGVDADLLSDEALGRDAPTWGWNAGLSLNWSLFDGFARRSRVREGEAALMVFDARRDGQRQAILGELEQALLAVTGSKAELEASNEALAAARERLVLAEGRYGEGVGNAIELGDAQVEVTQAAAQLVQSRVGLSTARADLIHSLGRR